MREEFDAVFTTLTSAVSVEPRPTGGDVMVRAAVLVVVVCANAGEMAATLKTMRISF